MSANATGNRKAPIIPFTGNPEASHSCIFTASSPPGLGKYFLAILPIFEINVKADYFAIGELSGEVANILCHCQAIPRVLAKMAISRWTRVTSQRKRNRI